VHDGTGTSCGREDTPNPPPVPPTLAKAIAALVKGKCALGPFLSILVIKCPTQMV
jgi:hypothetical protein